MKYLNFVHFDVKSFEKWLKDNKYTKTDISKELGFAKGFISKCCQRGKMSTSAYKLLIFTYSLAEGSFILKQEQEPVNDNTDKVQAATVEFAEDIQEQLEKLAMYLLETAETLRNALNDLKGIGEE